MDFTKHKDNIAYALVAAVILMVAYNTYALATIAMPQANSGSNAADDVIPTGIPEIYGEELGVSYDDVSPYDQALANQVITKLSNLDRSLKVEGADKERYINVLYRMENGMSCEYCCGARSIIFENGEPACGCAHSFAMRGLAKYLIQNHDDEYTDTELLAEIGKWKALFFPSQTRQKAQILADKGLETDMVSLTSNKYRGIEKGTGSGGMVGGC